MVKFWFRRFQGFRVSSQRAAQVGKSGKSTGKQTPTAAPKLKPFELLMGTYNDTFTYNYRHGVNDKTVEIPYTLHYLSVPPESDVMFDNARVSHFLTRAPANPDVFIQKETAWSFRLPSCRQRLLRRDLCHLKHTYFDMPNPNPVLNPDLEPV